MSRDWMLLPQSLFRRLKAVTSLILLLLLAGCATYRSQPLPTKDDLLASVTPSMLASPVDLPPLRHHTLNPQTGFDAIGLAMLAVINNPELKTARKQLGIARAQVFAARLLPDPQLSLSTDHPTGNDSGLTNAQSAGLSYDLMDLITHQAHESDARNREAQQHLNLLWHEWLVAQKARQLYFQVLSDRQKLQLLEKTAKSQQKRYEVARQQMGLGNLTLDALSSDLVGYSDIQAQVYQARLAQAEGKQQLNALLGLKPNATIALQPLPQTLPSLPAQTAVHLPALIRRRPDLLALQAGYQSQEASVRESILRQFPAINLGFNEANDTSNVHTLGLGLQLNLPLWNANRGQIAVQRATRTALRQAYQSRLDKTVGELAKIKHRFSLLSEHYRQLQSTLPTLEKVYRRALNAYRAGNFSGVAYLNLQEALVRKTSELIDTRQSLWDAWLAYETLLGWPLS